MKKLVLILALALSTALGAALPGCAVSTPMRTLEGATEGLDTVLVVVTSATLAAEGRREFFDQSLRVYRGMSAQDGLLSYSIRRELLGGEVWTLTVWRDREALRQFVRSPRHREAMERGLPAVVDMRTAEAVVDAASVPVTWSRALALL